MLFGIVYFISVVTYFVIFGSFFVYAIVPLTFIGASVFPTSAKSAQKIEESLTTSRCSARLTN